MVIRELECYLITAFLAVSGLFVINGCSNNSDSVSKSSVQEVTGVTVSTYDSARFGGSKCAPPQGRLDLIPLAFAEGFQGLTCQDNWVKVGDPNNPPDIEEKEMADMGYSSKRAFLDGALQKCNGTCVRISNGVYEINLPHCYLPNQANQCDGRIYKITNKKGQTFSGFSHSVCPGKHWKNVCKAVSNYGGLHCKAGNNHVDIGYDTEYKEAYIQAADEAQALQSVGLTDQNEGLQSIVIQ